jgi:hypothetical protein
MTYIVDNDVVLAQTLEGPLSAQIERFARWAREEGFSGFPTNAVSKFRDCRGMLMLPSFRLVPGLARVISLVQRIVPQSNWRSVR